MINEKIEQWKERVDYDFDNLNPKVINAELQYEKPNSYDFSRVGYRVGRRDGVKEVLRDLRRFVQYRIRGETCSIGDFLI